MSSHQDCWERFTVHCYVCTMNRLKMATRTGFMICGSCCLGSILSQAWANGSSLATLGMLKLTNRIQLYQQCVVETLIFVALFVAYVRYFMKKYIYFFSICLSFSEVISFSSWGKDHCKQMSTTIAQFVRERLASDVVSYRRRLESDCSICLLFNS